VAFEEYDETAEDLSADSANKRRKSPVVFYALSAALLFLIALLALSY